MNGVNWKITSAITVLLFLSLAGDTPAQGPVKSDQRQLIVKLRKADKYYKRGGKYYQRGNLEKAGMALKKSLVIFPHHDRSAFFLAQINYKNGEYSQALQRIKQAKANIIFLNNNGIHYQAGNQRGMDKTGVNDSSSIIKLIQKLRAQSKKLQESLIKDNLNCDGSKVSDYWRIKKDTIKKNEKRIRQLQTKLSKVSPGFINIPYQYHHLHGNILFKQKRFSEAKEQYREALRSNSFHPVSYNNLITCCYLLKQYEKAADYLFQANSREISINKRLSNAVHQALIVSGSTRMEQEYPGGVKRFTVLIHGKNRPIYENIYILFDPDTRDALIIDPGKIDNRIEHFITSKGLKVQKILNTHGHFDHTGANHYYSKLYRVKVVASIKDKPLFAGNQAENLPHEWIAGEKIVKIENFRLNIIPTPGHTPGSICFLMKGFLFSGDTLFKESIGSVKGNGNRGRIHRQKRLIKTIREKILVLAGDTIVLPGHGLATTVKHEKNKNPFCKVHSNE